MPELFRQLSILMGLPAAIIAGIGAAIILIARDWRVSLFAYIVMALMVTLLLSQVIPTEWALILVIVAGLIAIIFYISARQLGWRRQMPFSWEARWPQMASLTSFRVLAVILVGGAYFIGRASVSLPQVDALFRDAIVWLALMGLLGLSIHEEPFHAGLSLLTLLNAFELLLFTLEQRRMLVGLVGGGELLLGLAIAYLIVSRGLATEDTPELADGLGGMS